jgi:hypothetical protein
MAYEVGDAARVLVARLYVDLLRVTAAGCPAR